MSALTHIGFVQRQKHYINAGKTVTVNIIVTSDIPSNGTINQIEPTSIGSPRVLVCSTKINFTNPTTVFI